MPYQTPITDRDDADIIAQNSKAFFNIADWERIYKNARLSSALAAIMLDQAIQFDIIAAQTATTSPMGIRVSLNTLLANIERARLAMTSLLPSLAEVKDDWLAGASNLTPGYQHVNQWEQTIDAIWDHWNGDNLEVCPSLSGNVVVNNGDDKIYIDCVNTNGFSITVNSGGTMHVIG